MKNHSVITTERMQEIIVGITLGNEPIAQGEEERNFIARSKADILEIQNLGCEVSIPSEFPEPI